MRVDEEKKTNYFRQLKVVSNPITVGGMEKRRCEREVCGPLEATSASLFVESRQHLTQCVPSNDNSILIAFNAQKVHAEVYAAKMIC